MTGPATALLTAIVIGGSVAALAIAEPSNNIRGRAEAVDGDTLRLGNARVRLAEIDAPEAAQTCTDANGNTWLCGQTATAGLRYMLARDPYVTCTVRAHDRYGRAVARCVNGDGDLAARMVSIGMAVVYPRYSKGTYDDQQAAAKAEHAGMWAGTFAMPWDFRHDR